MELSIKKLMSLRIYPDVVSQLSAPSESSASLQGQNNIGSGYSMLHIDSK